MAPFVFFTRTVGKMSSCSHRMRSPFARSLLEVPSRSSDPSPSHPSPSRKPRRNAIFEASGIANAKPGTLLYLAWDPFPASTRLLTVAKESIETNALLKTRSSVSPRCTLVEVASPIELTSLSHLSISGASLLKMEAKPLPTYPSATKKPKNQENSSSSAILCGAGTCTVSLPAITTPLSVSLAPGTRSATATSVSGALSIFGIRRIIGILVPILT